MALTPGTRLGPYEVTAQIGVGGMGEVYKATDTNLKRAVAIKVLPASVAGDAERLARFQREAEVLAALNHPNIAQIHGLEKSAGTIALVMELVEGPTLADRIALGAIPIDEALPIAKQIAEALEAAHEQGIIHRDLKPANIKVRADGMVKVLDFGLAKAMEPTGVRAASNSMSPTITSLAMTQAGMILGTAAYMSPEQARGDTADKRADVWAFGVVLWEMLTGTRVFDGATVSDTLAAVLRAEPDWTALPAQTPAPVRRLLRRCLEKDRRRRLDSAAASRLEIEEALSAPAVGTAQAGVPSRAASSRVPWIALAAGALVAAVALAIPAVRHLREAPPPPPPETRTDIVTPATSDPVSFALSPDGLQIVFVASSDGVSRLWLRPLASATAQPLAGTEGATYPFWAPDSRSVGFSVGTTLRRLDLAGGTPQVIAATAGSRGATWNADGMILFTPTTASPLFSLPASGGQATAVTKLDRQQSHRFPSFLPDGRHFIFYAQGAPEDTGIYLGSLDSMDTERLTPADGAGLYLPSGWLLWVRAGALVGQRLDVGRKALTGNLVTVAGPVGFDFNLAVGAVSVSASGLIAFRASGTSLRQLAWFDRSGKALGRLGARDESELVAPRLSPDGRRVVAHRTVGGNTDIWLLDDTRTSRFTFDAALERYPSWSPDGSHIVFDSNRGGQRNLYQKASIGAQAEELLLETPQDKTANDWSAAGRFLLYHSIDPQTGRDLWVMPTEGDRTPWAFLKTTFSERNGHFSPDGRWVAYMSNESGRDEVYIRPLRVPGAADTTAGATAGQRQISTAGGIFPRWRPDGKELYYIGPNGEMMATPITASATTLEPGAPVVLFPTRIFGGGIDNQLSRQYDVAPDGRFLINTVLDDTPAPITLIQNWRPGN